MARAAAVVDEVEEDQGGGSLAVELGNRVAALRAERGWSQVELAERLGANRLSVMHIEAGRRLPRVERLLGLADAFGVSTDALLGRSVVVGEQQAWAALLAMMGSDGSNWFKGRDEITELATDLSLEFAHRVWQIVRAMAQEGAKKAAAS